MRIPGSGPGNKSPGLLTARKYEDSECNLEWRWLNSTIEINRYQDQLWKAIIQSWGMVDLIYRRRIKFKCCSHLNFATVTFWKGFSRHCGHLIESVVCCLSTISCHFTLIHNGNSQSTGKSLKRSAATTRKMCFSPLVELRHSLRLIYFRKQHTSKAASCVSAWAIAVNVQRYWRRGVSVAEEPFKWDKLYRNAAPLIPFLGVLQSCLHMKQGEAQNTPASERKGCSDRGQECQRRVIAQGVAH